jgi:NADH-quinone oxidoreductase subunit I
MIRYLAMYFGSIIKGVKSLLKGMRLTGYYFTHHKEIITQQYPENRDNVPMGDRFRGEVVMLHNESNEHRCTGCTACEIACPNGTIKIISKWEVNAEGKKKKAIDQFVYHLGMCTFCNLCIVSCPTDAIVMAKDF